MVCVHPSLGCCHPKAAFSHLAVVFLHFPVVFCHLGAVSPHFFVVFLHFRAVCCHLGAVFSHFIVVCYYFRAVVLHLKPVFYDLQVREARPEIHSSFMVLLCSGQGDRLLEPLSKPALVSESERIVSDPRRAKQLYPQRCSGTKELTDAAARSANEVLLAALSTYAFLGATQVDGDSYGRGNTLVSSAHSFHFWAIRSTRSGYSSDRSVVSVRSVSRS